MPVVNRILSLPQANTVLNINKIFKKYNIVNKIQVYFNTV